MKMKPTRLYFYRGMIERPSGWRRGYSANGAFGGVLYPWATKRECQSEAKKAGLKAVFIEEPLK